MIALTKTVREIALEQPSAIRVFEHFGIDYCCGGRMPLAEACAARGIHVESVTAAIEILAKGFVSAAQDWTQSALTQLSEHIVATHHAYVLRELPRLAVL